MNSRDKIKLFYWTWWILFEFALSRYTSWSLNHNAIRYIASRTRMVRLDKDKNRRMCWCVWRILINGNHMGIFIAKYTFFCLYIPHTISSPITYTCEITHHFGVYWSGKPISGPIPYCLFVDLWKSKENYHIFACARKVQFSYLSSMAKCQSKKKLYRRLYFHYIHLHNVTLLKNVSLVPLRRIVNNIFSSNFPHNYEYIDLSFWNMYKSPSSSLYKEKYILFFYLLVQKR